MNTKRIVPADIKQLALKRISILFAEAEKAFDKYPQRANRYVELARAIAQKARISIPASLKLKFCRYCGNYWVPGKTVRVRLQQQKVVYYCLHCKHYTRKPYIREKKARTVA